MANPLPIQMAGHRRGLYESFDVRGESPDGRYVFMLKQVLFRTPWRGDGFVTMAVMAFDRKTGRRACLADREAVSVTHSRQLKQITDWGHFAFSFGTGSFVDTTPARVRGKLHTTDGAARWDLTQDVREEAPAGASEFAWHSPWMRQGIEAGVVGRNASAQVTVADLSMAGEFILTTRHYWGNGYPYEFASGHGIRFEEDSGAAFYGFSSRLRLGSLKSPYLGMAGLVYRGRRYNFDRFTHSFRHRLESLDNYRWQVTFLSRDFGLEVRADGGNPRITPWLAWHADHPAGGRSVVKTTPFAHAELVLFHRRNRERIAVLKTDSLILNTLLPENAPEGSGFMARI